MNYDISFSTIEDFHECLSTLPAHYNQLHIYISILKILKPNLQPQTF